MQVLLPQDEHTVANVNNAGKATNLGIVEGDDNNKFNADNSVKTSEFLKMLLLSARIECRKWNEDSGEYWGLPYIEKANEIGLTNIGIDYAIGQGEKYISRYDTAGYMHKLFLDKNLKSKANVPVLVYEYSDNSNSIRGKAFNKYEDIKNLNKDTTAVYQLYMNNILNGYNETTMGIVSYFVFNVTPVLRLSGMRSLVTPPK